MAGHRLKGTVPHHSPEYTVWLRNVNSGVLVAADFLMAPAQLMALSSRSAILPIWGKCASHLERQTRSLESCSRQVIGTPLPYFSDSTRLARNGTQARTETWVVLTHTSKFSICCSLPADGNKNMRCNKKAVRPVGCVAFSFSCDLKNCEPKAIKQPGTPTACSNVFCKKFQSSSNSKPRHSPSSAGSPPGSAF